jgi:hypothetical protein
MAGVVGHRCLTASTDATVGLVGLTRSFEKQASGVARPDGGPSL